MKKVFLLAALAVVLAAVGVYFLGHVPAKWSGVDETVVEKYAEEAGRPPRKPYINTDQGDLLLFFFLIAGVAGGFVGGYCFRELFPPQKKS
ncbi:MAG: hypothetical protein PHQ12_01335 [Chthoniobacteraceae bacterium]|nr:hypothetical protein [Chthoniobacteraceae bacterium]